MSAVWCRTGQGKSWQGRAQEGGGHTQGRARHRWMAPCIWASCSCSSFSLNIYRSKPSIAAAAVMLNKFQGEPGCIGSTFDARLGSDAAAALLPVSATTMVILKGD